MHIERVFIATHKGDVRQARICVASIRYWYPDIPIALIKDYYGGDFSTDEIERVWNVTTFETTHRRFGWGMSKLEPVFSERGSRFMILDSDTVFTGKVLTHLENHTEDFVVHFENQPPQRLNEIYFDLEKLRSFDPDFKFDGQVFNTGQYVATGGLLRREDFAAVSWNTSPPSLTAPEIFKNGDQGVLNYVLLKKAAQAELSIGAASFMRWPLNGIDDIDLAKLATDSPYTEVIHWAGLSRPRLGSMIRADILRFFEDFYYSRVPLGTMKKQYRGVAGQAARLSGKVSRRIKTATRNRRLDSRVRLQDSELGKVSPTTGMANNLPK